MIRKFVLGLTAVTLGLYFGASSAASVRHPARIAQILDAATYVVDVELDGETVRITLSLNDIAAPKLYGTACERSAARQAKAFAQEILRFDDRVTVYDLGRSSGRFIGDIEFDGRSLRDVLVRFQQVTAVGAPAPWCEATDEAESAA